MSKKQNASLVPNSDSLLATSTLRIVAWRIVPFICLLYVLNILDRANVGFARLVAGTDVSSPEAIAELFQQVDTQFGRVDFLGNIAGDGHLAKPEELTITDLHRVLQNLVVGRFAMCQEAGRRMLAQGRGSIMNIGSLASSTALGRGHIAYSMAMGAVIQMTRELSTEWSYRGVRVNCVTPAQVGIGRIIEEPVVRDGRLEVGLTLTLSLTFDHRILDGGPAARFLQAIATAIANPSAALLS